MNSKRGMGDWQLEMMFKEGSLPQFAKADVPPSAETSADTELDLEKLLEGELEPNCKVFIHNDDVTPYEFVVVILHRVFELSPLEAERVTFVAHTNGIAHVTTLPCPEAYKRVGKAHFAASLDGYPLMFTVEQET